VQEVASVYSDHKARELATDLVSDKIFRAIYIPPISHTVLPHGGILYFNQIGNTAVSSFGEPEACVCVCAIELRTGDHRYEVGKSFASPESASSSAVAVALSGRSGRQRE
jgi:hypothetical protein